MNLQTLRVIEKDVWKPKLEQKESELDPVDTQAK